MSIYMKYNGGDGQVLDLARLPTGVGTLRERNWLPYPGAAALAAQVRRQYPAGVDQILIGLLKVPGYRVLHRSANSGLHVAAGDVNGDGIIAILIGLLLPAVQKLQSSQTGEGQLLGNLLRVGGRAGIAMADGSVRSLGSNAAASLDAHETSRRIWGDPHVLQRSVISGNLGSGVLRG